MSNFVEHSLAIRAVGVDLKRSKYDHDATKSGQLSLRPRPQEESSLITKELTAPNEEVAEELTEELTEEPTHGLFRAILAISDALGGGRIIYQRVDTSEDSEDNSIKVSATSFVTRCLALVKCCDAVQAAAEAGRTGSNSDLVDSIFSSAIGHVLCACDEKALVDGVVTTTLSEADVSIPDLLAVMSLDGFEVTSEEDGEVLELGEYYEYFSDEGAEATGDLGPVVVARGPLAQSARPDAHLDLIAEGVRLAG